MMKRKSMAAITMSFLLVISMLAGCGNKQTENTDKPDTAETTAAAKVIFDTTPMGNVIAGETVPLSDLLHKVTPEKGQGVTGASLTYRGETVALAEDKDPRTDTKAYKVVRDKTIKELVSKDNVPNVSLTFSEAAKTAEELKVSVSVTEKDGKSSDSGVTIKIRVLPETVKPIKAIAQNLKLSKSLEDYDFNVRAKNIADKAPDTVESIKVKKSNVKYGKAGHYEVTYEVKLKPEKADKETEKNLPEDKAEKGNAEPDTTVNVTTDVEVTDKKTDDVITDSNDTTADTDSITPAENGTADTDSSTPTENETAGGSNTPADGNTAFGGDTDPSDGGSSNASSGGGSSSESSNPPAHTHDWQPHTATKQVWVPNIVTVTDYGTQAAHAYDTICCNCGTIFNSPGECADHQFATGHGGRQNIACTHTEDHGYNETQSYTDYYYCSCGATK